MNELRRQPRANLRHGLSPEILSDRAVAATIDAAMLVHLALGEAHQAATYRGALAVELAERNLPFHREATFSVLYRQQIVGTFCADLLIAERVLVRVIADRSLTAEHKSDTLRGLAAGGVDVGLVFNFGLPELFFARIL